jgi:hypothetical protein
MLRRLTGGVALVCLFSVMSAPVAESEAARAPAMQFALRQETGACGDTCRTWISASGLIEAETARDFEAFAETNDVRGATLVLNSEGGSVHGAIALGRIIRTYDITTTVGRAIAASPKTGSSATLLPRADCESMCAFVLLAGSKRFVPEEARVRVHQIWLGDRRDDATAATYSAEDLMLVQRDIGKLAQYTIEMGGTIELLDLALRNPPWEPMRTLTRDELRRTGLDTGDVSDPRPAPPVAGSAPALTTGSVRRVSATGNVERGWAMVDRDGAPVLTRRHPLTVDGEEIGMLDVAISCGEKAGEYRLSYAETRRAREDAALPAPLRRVDLRINYRIVPLTLTPIAAKAETGAGERVSRATGTLTAATLGAFANTASRSLTLEATAGDDAVTSIRIGNTNVARYFPQFAASCARSGGARAELRAKP